MEEMNRFGFDNFEITVIEEIPDSELNEREEYWIRKLDSRNSKIGYNSKTGGIGGALTDESKEKMSNSSKGFKHSEEEKLRRSKAIFIVKDSRIIPCVSSKLYADSIKRSRSEVSAAIKRGIKINGCYIFYQDRNERIQCIKNITEKKSKQNERSKKSLKEYLAVYYLFFSDNDLIDEEWCRD
jgi:hypothetical protein